MQRSRTYVRMCARCGVRLSSLRPQPQSVQHVPSQCRGPVARPSVRSARSGAGFLSADQPQVAALSVVTCCCGQRLGARPGGAAKLRLQLRSGHCTLAGPHPAHALHTHTRACTHSTPYYPHRACGRLLLHQLRFAARQSASCQHLWCGGKHDV